jgi:hypothetical protein
VEAAEDDPSRDQDHQVHQEDAVLWVPGSRKKGRCHTAMMTATAAPARRNPNRACRAGNANPVQPNSSQQPGEQAEISVDVLAL